MVSQLLLGETAEVLETIDRWIYIRTRYDNYEGWVNPGQCAYITAEQEQAWLSEPRLRRSYFRNFTIHHVERGDALVVPTGALVQFTSEGVLLPDGEYLKSDHPLQSILKGDLISTAERLLGVPYLWGGRSDLGFDCSGFVQTLFALYGFELPRDSRQQFTLADPAITDLKGIALAEAGDLVFFANPEGRIVHVGLYWGNGCLIHAGPNIRINCFSPDFAQRVPYSYEVRLAERFKGILRISDLCLPHRLQLGYTQAIFEHRSPKLLNPYA